MTDQSVVHTPCSTCVWAFRLLLRNAQCDMYVLVQVRGNFYHLLIIHLGQFCFGSHGHGWPRRPPEEPVAVAHPDWGRLFSLGFYCSAIVGSLLVQLGTLCHALVDIESRHGRPPLLLLLLLLLPKFLSHPSSHDTPFILGHPGKNGGII